MPSIAGIGNTATPRQLMGYWAQGLLAAEEGLWFDSIAMRAQCDDAVGRYEWFGTSPLTSEWTGERKAASPAKQRYELANKVWETTEQFSVEELENDQTGTLQYRMQMMGQEAALHRQRLAISLLNTPPKAYDAQDWFSTSHSEGSSGTISNDITKTDAAWLQVASVSKPTADEMSSAILNAAAFMGTFKDDQGRYINEGASQFAIMLPTVMTVGAWGGVWDAILGSGRSNTLLSAQRQFTFRAIHVPQLTATTKFVLLRTDLPIKPFLYQVSKEPTISYIGAGSENAFFKNKYVFGTKGVYNVGIGPWQLALRCTIGT